jgi:hypothetical protein
MGLLQVMVGQTGGGTGGSGMRHHCCHAEIGRGFWPIRHSSAIALSDNRCARATVHWIELLASLKLALGPQDSRLSFSQSSRPRVLEPHWATRMWKTEKHWLFVHWLVQGLPGVEQ